MSSILPKFTARAGLTNRCSGEVKMVGGSSRLSAAAKLNRWSRSDSVLQNHLSCRTHLNYSTGQMTDTPLKAIEPPSTKAFHHFERVNIRLVGRSHPL